ncbi:MAG: hypothetical protein JWO05_3389 [Gemmatimonadetes bacterium]|nr:hypothetical protein [Gemmatimonadota bacterium]
MNRPGTSTPAGVRRLDAAPDQLPLTERAEPLRELERLLDEAEQGRGNMHILFGEGGVGKTRLAQALAQSAARKGFSIAIGRAYPVETGVPYAVFGDALLPVLRALEPQALTVLSRGGTAELAQLFPALALERAASAPRGDPADHKARLLWNFTQFLGRLAARQKLLIILENLQWADPSSLELLHFVARQVTSEKIVIVGTYNETERASNPVLAQTEQSLLSLGVAHATRIQPLSLEGVQQLLRRAFGADEAAVRGFARALHARTRGNPFFVEETLKALMEEGRLLQREGQWAGWELEEFALPSSVREALRLRLERLSATSRTAAELVAVLGTRTSFDILAHLTDTNPRDVLPSIDELRRGGVLVEAEEAGVVVYDFAHPMIRDTIYAEIGLARARILHADVAERLESFHGADALRHADVIAYHLMRADQKRLAGKAVHYLREAGRAALAQHANREAVNYLGMALDLAERAGALAPDAQAALASDLARGRQRMGDYEGALRLWDRARRVAEAAGDHATLAQLHRSIGLACFWSGQPSEALAHYDAAIAAAGHIPSPAIAARTRIAKGSALITLGRHEAAGVEVAAALAAAQEIGEPGLLARAHRANMLLHVWTGPPDKARHHGRQAIALATAPELRGVAWSAHWALAVLAGLTGIATDVSVHLAEAERLADELQSPLLRVWTAEVAIEYLAGIGEWDAALVRAERTITLARSFGQKAILPRLLVWAGIIYLARGELERGKSCVDEAWQLSGAERGDEARDVHTVVPAHTGRAAYYLAMRDYENAIEVGRRGLAIADRSGYVVWAIHRLMPIIAESLLWRADMDGARALATRLHRDSSRLGHALGMAWADTTVAVAEMLRGDKQASVDMLRRVAGELEAIPFVPDAARVRRQLAIALEATGDTDGAVAELRLAHEVFARLGAKPELDATRDHLRQLGARPPVKSTTQGLAGLTGREVEIVRLVAARRSNKEIGSALDISARTVSTHLSNIFGKLGVASRGELTDFARENGLAIA